VPSHQRTLILSDRFPRNTNRLPAIRAALEHVLHHHGEAIKSSPHVGRPAGHPDLRAPTVSGSSPTGLQGIGEPCRVRRRHILRQAQNPAIAQHHLDS
jgi:hypothetical protein